MDQVHQHQHCQCTIDESPLEKEHIRKSQYNAGDGKRHHRDQMKRHGTEILPRPRRQKGDKIRHRHSHKRSRQRDGERILQVHAHSETKRLFYVVE